MGRADPAGRPADQGGLTAPLVSPLVSVGSVLLELDEDRWTLVMRRRFPHDPQRLWAMITDPERLARWSPIVPDRPMSTPGPAFSRENPEDVPVDAEVLVVDAPEQHVGGDFEEDGTVAAGEGGAERLRQTRIFGRHRPGAARQPSHRIENGTVPAQKGATPLSPSGENPRQNPSRPKPLPDPALRHRA